MLILKGQPIPKKNSQEIHINRNTGKRFVSQNERYKNYEQSCLWQLKTQKEQIPEPPLNVCCIYYRADNRRCDLVNLLEATDDILVRAGLIEDDNYKIIAGHDGSRVFYDKSNPRVEITISRIQ